MLLQKSSCFQLLLFMTLTFHKQHYKFSPDSDSEIILKIG